MGKSAHPVVMCIRWSITLIISLSLPGCVAVLAEIYDLLQETRINDSIFDFKVTGVNCTSALNQR